MSLVLPIYYGTVSQLDTKKKDNRLNYKWLVFLRGVNNEDLTPIIESVVFELHESFDNHIKIVNSFPFVLQEEGWGEFGIKIKINLKEEYSKFSLNFTHELKFHHNKTHKKPFLFQSYDEIIFTNPSESLLEISNSLKSRNDELMEILCNTFGYDNKELYQFMLSENKINFKQHEDLLNKAIEYIDFEIENSLKDLIGIETKIMESNLLDKRNIN